MKITIAILTLFFFFQFDCFAFQPEELNQKWIAVHSEANKEGWIEDYKGVILDFSGKTGILTSFRVDHNEYFDYHLKNNQYLYINDTIFAEIISLAKDSLVLLIDSVSAFFVPVIETNSTIPNDIFYNSLWHFESELTSGKLYFHDNYIIDTLLRNNLFFKVIEGRELYTYHWNLKEYKNSTSLLLEESSNHVIVNQLVEGIRDTLIFITYYDKKAFRTILTKHKAVNDSQLNRYLSIIENKNWEIDTFNIVCEKIGGMIIYTRNPIIYLNDIKNKFLRYEFESNNFKLFVSDNLIKEGKWRITSDFKYIIFDELNGPCEFYELNGIEVDKLEIGIYDEFGIKTTEPNKEIETKYCKIELKLKQN